jgi:hypothetical protein
VTEPTLPQRKIDFYFDFIGGGVGDLNPVHLIFVVVLLSEMKNGGIEDADRLFFYLNLVSSFADKV